MTAHRHQATPGEKKARFCFYQAAYFDFCSSECSMMYIHLLITASSLQCTKQQQILTTSKKDRIRQSNSFVVVCKSRRQGGPCWKILIRSKKLLQRLKAQRRKKGLGFNCLVATDLCVSHAAGIKLNFFGHCPRITFCWKRQLHHRRDLHHFQRRRQTIQHDLELQLPQWNKTHVDIHNIQASFLHQLENAAATITSPESCQDHFVRVGAACDAASSCKSTNVNNHCAYSENDIDSLFSTIDL